MKILAVDSDKNIRLMCEKALGRAGHEVQTCSSGKEAEPRLKEPWDVIITDVAMSGGLDGLALLDKIWMLDGVDIILLASSPQVELTISILRDNAYDFLVKPFPAEALVNVVRRCVDKRNLSRELLQERRLRQELDQAYVQMAKMKKAEETFGQFMTPEVAKFVLEHPPDFLKFGEHQIVSVLFADVRGFTPFIGRVTPDEAVLSLNEVLSYVIAAVRRERGVVNKFTGDGIMAIFGAPVPLKDHAQAAARAALWARESVETLAKMRQEWKLEHLRLGFGLNTGEVLAGYLGNRDRAEYSVFGHPVNLAARMEQAADPGQILIGPGSAEIIGGDFHLGPPKPCLFHGIPEPVLVSELLGKNS